MRITRLTIRNFRGVLDGQLLLPQHAVLVGDNNIGKSTVLEAIDLVLGPERLSRRPIIDEHDFTGGRYIDTEGRSVSITIEVVVADLKEDQQRHFRDHLEWWATNNNTLLSGPPAEGTDAPSVVPALRLQFEGAYDKEEDDFAGNTYFASPAKEDGSRDTFRAADKRVCGFLFLRTLRTGNRALSLERGSLLDIILKLQEKQLRMWEEVLRELRVLPVAENKELGITEVLASVQEAVRRFVPADWVSNPHMRVSDLTRETLRKTLTVFMGTGSKDVNGQDYAAPFQHQGTGTINTLVLALLSLIADLKQNVIFAMEEPEIAIPPHAQKCIIESVRGKSAQALFTSHSPYVLEEFAPEQVLVLRREHCVLSAIPASLPPAVRPKKYKEEFRRRFCEGLLARRILITEGRTEYDAFPAAARRLHELNPAEFSSLEALGLAVVSADSDSQVAPLGAHFAKLGKMVFAVFDQQAPAQKAAIAAAVTHPYEGPELTFERTLLNGTAEAALRRYAASLVSSGEWPPHLAANKPQPATTLADLRAALSEYLTWAKGTGTAADLLLECAQSEMPTYVVDTLRQIKQASELSMQTSAAGAVSASVPADDAVPKMAVAVTAVVSPIDT
jgi:putative ATP-dependent endonuclease of the OLD family